MSKSALNCKSVPFMHLYLCTQGCPIALIMRRVAVSPQKTNDDCVLLLSFMGGNFSPVNSCVSSWLAFKGTLLSLSN